MEDEIATEENNWDPNFIKELNRRNRQFKSASAKTYTWEETKKTAIDNLKARKK